MAKIISQCPICHKKGVTEKGFLNLGNAKFITLDCGHSFKQDISVTSDSTITLKDGKELYPFQVEGVHFIERSGFSGLIADEQGLGKTIQAIALMHLHMDELKPILIVVKSSLSLQWQRHVMVELEKFAPVVWRNSDIIPAPIYITSFDMVGKIDWSKFKPSIKTVIVDECQYIKSHEAKRTGALRELINREVTKTPVKLSDSDKSDRLRKREIIARDLMRYHGISERFELNFYDRMGKVLGLTKCRVFGEGIIKGEIILNKHHVETASEDDVIETILHEIAHAITPGAGHVKIWKETSISIGGNGRAFADCDGTIDLTQVYKEKEIQHKIFLSGTPILNNAIEYWPALNMLRPNLFPNRDRFAKWEVGYYQNSKGVFKPGGIRYPKEFKEKTSDFIIRRTKKEVLPDLPTITRDFRYHEINADEVKAYNLGIKKLDEFLKNADVKSFNFTSQLQGHIMILRHITGLAKINPILEYVDEFLGNEGKKLAIFHHHIDVGEILRMHLEKRGIKFVHIVSTYDTPKRMQMLDEFRNNDEVKIMIAPSLAMGEGYDLDFCDTAIMLEREWNPAKEEQVEGRLIRATPEAIAKAARGELKATVVYPIAVHTIDEFFAELVERKRQYVKETLDGKSDRAWDESDVMLELAKIAIARWKEN